MKNKEIGELIRKYRRAKGLTQSELAKKVGLSMPTISMVENGEKHDPRPSTIKQLAVFLGIPESAFRDRGTDENISTSNPLLERSEAFNDANTSSSQSTSATDDVRFPIGLMIGNFHVEIEPSVKKDIRRMIYWSVKTGIITKEDVEELLNTKDN